MHSMDRLARNLDDLREDLTRTACGWNSSKKALMLTGEDSPMANLMLSVMGASAESEHPGTAAGGHRLCAEAQYMQGRKKSLTPERAADLVQRVGSGIQKVVLGCDYGTSKETVDQYLRHAKPG